MLHSQVDCTGLLPRYWLIGADLRGDSTTSRYEYRRLPE